MKENKHLGAEDLSFNPNCEALKSVAKEAIYEVFNKSLFLNHHKILFEVRYESSVRSFELAGEYLSKTPNLFAFKIYSHASKIIDEIFYPCDSTYCHFAIYGMRPDRELDTIFKFKIGEENDA